MRVSAPLREFEDWGAVVGDDMRLVVCGLVVIMFVVVEEDVRLVVCGSEMTIFAVVENDTRLVVCDVELVVITFIGMHDAEGQASQV